MIITRFTFGYYPWLLVPACLGNGNDRFILGKEVQMVIGLSHCHIIFLPALEQSRTITELSVCYNPPRVCTSYEIPRFFVYRQIVFSIASD